MPNTKNQPSQEEGQAPPYSCTDNITDQSSDWNDCDVPVSDSDPENQDPFIYHGAGPTVAASIDTDRSNIVLFGQTGAGKSSVINLMAGREVAATSSSAKACTLHTTEYSFTLPGITSFTIYDTVGLNEPEMGVNDFFDAIGKAYQLITTLHNAGGIDLLIFCIESGRITATMQRNYRLFHEFLCAKEVRLAFIVTRLETEDRMENWWKKNAKHFEKYGMRSVGHACVTATPAGVAGLAAKRAESRTVIQEMLRVSLDQSNEPHVQDVWSWFARMVEMLKSFLMRSLPMFLRRTVIRRNLKTRCKLSEDEAQKLADILAR